MVPTSKMRIEAQQIAGRDKRKLNKQISDLKGIEKIEYDIAMIKSRIKNAKEDLKMIKSITIQDKILYMNSTLIKLEKNLEYEKNNNIVGTIRKPNK